MAVQSRAASNANTAGAGTSLSFVCPSFSEITLLSDRTPAPMLRQLSLSGLLLLTSLGFNSAARAQNAFVVVDEGAPKIVKEIRSHRPLIEKAGKLATASTEQYGFLRATIYRPGLVTLTSFRVNTSHIESTSGGSFNYE